MNEVQILLVEDSVEDAFFFTRALGKVSFPHKLSVVGDGQAAVEFISRTGSETIDLIFLDIKLPLLGGFDVLRWVGLHAPELLSRTIILSGSAHEADQRLARELGAASYLVKPVSVQTLQTCFTSAALS